MTSILLLENPRLLEIDYKQTIPFEPVFNHLFKPVLDLIFSPTNTNYRVDLTAISLLLDVGRMFLLTWTSWTLSKCLQQMSSKMMRLKPYIIPNNSSISRYEWDGKRIHDSTESPSEMCGHAVLQVVEGRTHTCEIASIHFWPRFHI